MCWQYHPKICRSRIDAPPPLASTSSVLHYSILVPLEMAAAMEAEAAWTVARAARAEAGMEVAATEAAAAAVVRVAAAMVVAVEVAGRVALMAEMEGKAVAEAVRLAVEMELHQKLADDDFVAVDFQRAVVLAVNQRHQEEESERLGQLHFGV